MKTNDSTTWSLKALLLKFRSLDRGIEGSVLTISPEPPVENYSNPNTCFFHVLFKGAALAFYILSALFIDNFVIIFVVTVFLAALDFWVVKNVIGRILVGRLEVVE